MGKLNFCANLSFMFKEQGTLVEKIQAAAQAGFGAFEVAFPYDVPLDELIAAKVQSGMSLELINIFPGNDGEMGLAALPGRENEFKESLAKAISYAKALDCKRIHIMSGKTMSTNITDTAMDDVYLDNLVYASEVLEQEGFIGLIEPINNQTVPNYYMNDFQKAVDIINKVNKSSLKLQLDIFHLQHLEGNISFRLKELLPLTEHIQIAQVPDRHEPNTAGELDYRYILQRLEDLQYQKWIGLEYAPANNTIQGLSWVQEFGYSL